MSNPLVSRLPITFTAFALSLACATEKSGGPGPNTGQDQLQPDSQTLPPTLEPAPTTGATALAPDPTPAEVATPKPPPASAPPTDEQIAGFAEAVISAQIEQAKLARLKTKNEKVKKLAASMLARFGQAQQRQAKLRLKPAESELATQMGVDASDAKRRLDNASGPDFDRIYVAVQVDAHRKLLDILDRELLPNAKNAELKALLLDARPKVAEQLLSLEAAQASLGP